MLGQSLVRHSGSHIEKLEVIQWSLVPNKLENQQGNLYYALRPENNPVCLEVLIFGPTEDLWTHLSGFCLCIQSSSLADVIPLS